MCSCPEHQELYKKKKVVKCDKKGLRLAESPARVAAAIAAIDAYKVRLSYIDVGDFGVFEETLQFCAKASQELKFKFEWINDLPYAMSRADTPAGAQHALDVWAKHPAEEHHARTREVFENPVVVQQLQTLAAGDETARREELMVLVKKCDCARCRNSQSKACTG